MRVKLSERRAVARGADFLRQLADRRVGPRQRRIAQEQRRRKTLDGAAHHAVGIFGLDFAVDIDAQGVERAIGGEDVGEVAERILTRGKLARRRTPRCASGSPYWPSWLRGVTRNTWITPAAGGS